MSQQKKDIAVVVHGGAGKIDADHARLKLPGLRRARDVAWEALEAGVPGEAAVVEALHVLEGDEYFNAGFGGYPNANGIVLTDVGLMRGNRDFISIINCRKVKFPSRIALDMLRPGKALLTVWTHEHMTALEQGSPELKEKYGLVLTHDELIAPFVRDMMKKGSPLEVTSLAQHGKFQHGTIGCVVRDSDGNICAGTSTGGVSLKSNGRIGDTPIIGSGVYADNEICALSTTGHGESFLLSAISSFVIAEMRRELRQNPNIFLDSSSRLNHILKNEFQELARRAPGRGAMIVMPPKGNPSYTFNSSQASISYRYVDHISDSLNEDTLIDSLESNPIR